MSSKGGITLVSSIHSDQIISFLKVQLLKYPTLASVEKNFTSKRQRVPIFYCHFADASEIDAEAVRFVLLCLKQDR